MDRRFTPITSRIRRLTGRERAGNVALLVVALAAALALVAVMIWPAIGWLR